jgi:DNA-binding SARP family transcriptional activator
MDLETKVLAVLRLLAGESAAALAAEGVGGEEELATWRDLFVEGGSERLGAFLGGGEHGSLPGRQVASPTPYVRMTLIGHPMMAVVAEGQTRPIRWPLKRAMQLLAFLALKPGFKADKGDIIEALWSDASEETVRRNFHPTLSLARRIISKALGQPAKVVSQSQGLYGLDPEIYWRVDVLSFEEGFELGRRLVRDTATRTQAAEAWLECWSRYHGPLMQGHEESWLQERREVLYSAYVATLRHLGSLYADLGRHSEALDSYRALLVVEPLEEQAHLEVMANYARQGRRDLVRRQYVRLQELLKELNVEPMEETQERYHVLMR